MKTKHIPFAAAAEYMLRIRLVPMACILVSAATCLSAEISGELKQWHKVTVTYGAPESYSETGETNPFTDRRLDVVFTKGSKSYTVPGYFAADGNAANTGASEGKIWKAHFAPPETGRWSYSGKFYSGHHVHKSDNPGKPTATFTGEFKIAPTDKSGRDMRGKGWLEYVGGRYLRFKGTGEYFLKQGPDSPENLLAYRDFDGPFKNDGPVRGRGKPGEFSMDSYIKDYSTHVKDWKTGDPTWGRGKGKGLIGAINYLASEGMNSFSFLPWSYGDDMNVFPWLKYRAYKELRVDVSRLEQWAIVMEHGTKMGFFLHFKTQEIESELVLDKGNVGSQRVLYYRELIARFAHNPALNWNLGEEIKRATTAQKKSWAKYFWDNDPYKHHIVIHNGANHFDLLGRGSKLTGFSLQTSNPRFTRVHLQVKRYIDKSVVAGKPWAVACDEPGNASDAIRPDNDAGNSHIDGRKNALWGTFMAGGWGNEWYFGYKHAHSDLTLEDFRSRDKWWDYCRHALQFFKEYKVPVWEMKNDNSLINTRNGYCLYKPGKVYVVYLKSGGTAKLNVGSKKVSLGVKWFNPRTGGALQNGSVKELNGAGSLSIGSPPSDRDQDWAVLIKSFDSSPRTSPASRTTRTSDRSRHLSRPTPPSR